MRSSSDRPGLRASRIRRQALLASCALLLVLPSGALAGDISIPSGTTVTTTQTLTDVGDTGTVDSGGAIDVTDEDGLVLDNDDQTAVNNGDIDVERTGGPSLAGIGSLGANSNITNNGTITTTGDVAFGVVGAGGDAKITNTGTITTSGGSSFAILSTDDDVVIVNSGTLSTSGDDADAIHADESNAQITNSGSITTTGDDAHGIDADGANAKVTNSGTITTTNDDATGIDSDSGATNASITNSGTISVQGDGALGIESKGDGSTITNSGSITTAGSGAPAIGSQGDDSTITNSGTLTTTGFSSFGIGALGARADITNSSTITTAGEDSDGIFTSGEGATVRNSSTITTTGEDAFGIGSTGDDSEVTNTGTIVTEGEDSDGVNADGDRSTVLNSNTITTGGLDAHGIDADGDDTNVTNSGSITTTGVGGHGIDADGNNATIANTGSIHTSGAEAHGISATGSGATISNTSFDTIAVTGSNAFGIEVDNDNADVDNSGKITASGEDGNGVGITGNSAIVTNTGTIENSGSRTGTLAASGHGIAIVGDDATVTSSGTVSSDNGSAIYIDGANAMVTLQDGSRTVGILTFTDASTAAFTYSGNRTAIFGFSSVPGTLGTGDLVFRTSGNTVTYLNPDNFQLQTTAPTFAALTRELADGVERQMDLNRLGETGFVATNGTPAETVADRWAVWAAPFGGVLNRSGSNGFDHSFGGLMAGAERGLAPDLRAGVTGGFSFGQTDSDNDIHSADTYSFFAGGYLTRNWQATFAQVSVLGGYLGSDEQVTVLNNMVAGGLQDLSIDYGYVFVSPTARVGHAFASAQGTFTPSVRARYSGLWQTGDATETSTGLTVSGRSLNVVELRGQTEFDFTPVVRDNGAFHFGIAAGIDGTFTLSDSIDGDLSGTALNLSIDNDDAVIRGFAAANAIWQTNGGARLLAGIEGGYDSAETLSAIVRLGGKVSF